MFKTLSEKIIKEKDGKKIIILPPGEGYIVSQHTDSNIVILKYNYLKTTHIRDKGIAFIKDVERFKKEIDMQYSNSGYHSKAEGDLEELTETMEDGSRELFDDARNNCFARVLGSGRK